MNNYDPIEKFIRKNRNLFADEDPSGKHMERFLVKLDRRLRHLISIVPHLVKVALATLVIFLLSIAVWNRFLRKDRHEITLKEKICNTVESIRYLNRNL